MVNRKIVLDTETTGLNVLLGDRIIEIAAVEILDDEILGNEFHFYLNPERDIPEESTKIHGITNNDIKDKPLFKDIAQQFIEFLGDSLIIAHNAEFDRAFINTELDLIARPILHKERFIDSLVMARECFPGEKLSLDNLCLKFDVDLSSRQEHHGALIDVKLLAKVYSKLCKINPNVLFNYEMQLHNTGNLASNNFTYKNFTYRDFKLSSDEIDSHNKFLAKIKNNLWND